MGMVDRQQLFASLAHRSLRGKQIFRGGFVSDERLAGDVSERVNSLSRCRVTADEATTFARSVTAGVIKDFVNMCLMN